METDDIFGIVLLILGFTFMMYYGYMSVKSRKKNL